MSATSRTGESGLAGEAVVAFEGAFVRAAYVYAVGLGWRRDALVSPVRCTRGRGECVPWLIVQRLLTPSACASCACMKPRKLCCPNFVACCSSAPSPHVYPVFPRFALPATVSELEAHGRREACLWCVTPPGRACIDTRARYTRAIGCAVALLRTRVFAMTLLTPIPCGGRRPSIHVRWPNSATGAQFTFSPQSALTQRVTLRKMTADLGRPGWL